MVQLQSKHGAKLHTLEELRKSGFGRPSPRHGLKLLYWFVNNCLELDFHDNMLAQCHPERGDYGFHHFGNFEEILPLLAPNSRETYYDVGNLNPERYPEALDLPNYVREKYGVARNYQESNKDRIIIRYKSPNLILKVYITQHHAEGFDADRTHLLSCNLIENIKHPDLDLGTFLIQTGFTTSLRFLPVLYDLISPTQPLNSITENRPQSMPHRRENIQDPEQGLSLPAPRRTRKLCILGGIFSLILLVIVIVAVLYFLGIF